MIFKIKRAGERAERPAFSSRRVRRAIAEMVIALLLVGLAGFALSACTVEVGGGSDEITSSTQAAASQSSTTTQAPSITTTSTAGKPNVIPSGQGVVSPAQQVAEVLVPSVVNVKVTSVYQIGPWQQEAQGEGSGVIYTSDGMIITNNHVVRGADGGIASDIVVTLTTGESLPARVIGTDPLTDLAVIKVDADFELPAATFVTESPEVGEYAVAIGSPLGYEGSVTLGIVSGLDRSVEGAYGTEGVALNNLIQTDAPISPGNSGGALANANGQVIGINVAYEPPTSGAVSIGFAIPSAVVVKVADEIISTGKVTHAYMGVRTVTVTSRLQEQFKLSRSSGILVYQVTPNSPAAKAGLQEGDIIIEVDGEEMVEASDLLVSIRDRKPGDQVKVLVDRGGEEMEITVTLEERPPEELE